MVKDCLFCKIANKEIPADIVHEDEHVIAFNDIAPKAPVHVLIIPKEHIDTMNSVPPDDEGILGALMLAARDLGKKLGVDGSGYRVVVNCGANAGQEVFHLHVHLLGGRSFTWPPG